MRTGLLKRLYRGLILPEKLLRSALLKVLGDSPSLTRFGWRESLVFATAIDVWQRYSRLADKISRAHGKRISILDLGSGGSGVSAFLRGERYYICVLDLDFERLTNRGYNKGVHPVNADATALPFASNSFDYVVSCDNLEHIPPTLRDRYYHECRRVARRGVVMHVPADSPDGTFSAGAFDRKFNKMHHRFFFRDEGNVAEHIQNGVPTLDELESGFPGATLEGRTNGSVWVWYMFMERIPYVRLLTGLFYLAWKARSDHQPPFYACLVSWQKSALAEGGRDHQVAPR